MPKSCNQALTALGALGLALAMNAPAAEAGSSRGRQSMEQCVQRVLSGLARQRAPETSVGPAVIQQCDGPLRATLTEAIRTGEAGGCTVESCIAMARERAAAEAAGAYRQFTTR
jgi:hypothetical protein